MANVRGMAFLGTAHWIKERFGREELQAIVEGGGPATIEAFAHKIDGLSLYPYAALVGLLRSADARLGTGDLAYAKKLGDLAARFDLSTIFRGYAARPDPEAMIRACAPVWSMYTDGAGTMVAESVDKESTVLSIYDFPAMDPAHCKLMEGWMIAAMDFVGAQVLPGARERKCMSCGDDRHEFWCRWELKG